MIESKVQYIKNLGELLDKKHGDVDYILKSSFPLDYNLFEKLLDLEMQNADILNTTFLEFEKLGLTGRQILNLSNNMNLNLLIKKPTDEQMKELLIGYADVDMKKCVYPIKIIVLVVLYALYLRHFYNRNVFDEWEELTKSVFDKFISYKYIQDKYSMEFIINWSQWYLVYLKDQRPDFIQDFVQHCMYLYDIAYNYYKKSEPTKLPNLGEGTRIRAGLYVPLANVMVDLRFNPYKIVALRKKYDYAISTFGGMVIRTLAPIIDYTLAVEAYLKEEKKEKIFIENLKDLKDTDIIKFLKEKKIIETKQPVSEVDLFPIEVVSV